MSFHRLGAAGPTAALIASAAFAGAAHAQGTTTGAVTGRVTDASGTPVANAQVEIRNTATGARNGQVTRENGRFYLPNLDVGGGYVLTVRRIGFAPETRPNVVVSLSQTTRVDLTLQAQATTLTEVAVTAPRAGADFSPTRQGTQTTVSDTLVRRLPTLNRDVADLTRLSPQVATDPSGRQSAAGQSNRFSNIQVDGVSLANRFGLGNSPTLGAQVQGRAIALEAIKEFQVLISPYDVRQGNFTGALVNAVTQSGTNEFKGSAFLYYRDQALARDTAFLRASPFLRRQLGASLGGPILRDRLRFFVTAETSQNQSPATGPYFDPRSPNGIVNTTAANLRLTQAQVDSFALGARNRGIADVGAPTLFGLANPLLNTFARLDYQISSGNRLVLRNIYNDQQQDDFTRSNATFNFTSNYFQRREISNQTVAQLFSNLPGGASNELIIGYTNTRFKRNPSVNLPQFLVQNIGGAGTGLGFRGGTENSSQGNALNERLLEFQDNVTIPRGAHTITLGTRNEIYRVYNAFLQNSYGNYTFGSLADWVNPSALPISYAGSGSLGGPVAAEFTAGQFGGYVQDQWAINPRFTLTAGVRVDVPVLFDKPVDNPTVRTNFGRGTSDVPSGNLQFSPRVGFNYDVTGNQVTQLRGGVGLFQGPPAYVWLSNQYQNTGLGLAQLTCGVGQVNGGAPAFTPTPVAPTSCSARTGITGANANLNGTPGVTLNAQTFQGTVNLADPNLKFPQLLRATLGADRRLGGGLIASIDALYSKNLNSLFYTNINLPVDTLTALDQQGRRVYGARATTGAVTISPRYPIYGTNVINLGNQSKDYAYSVTGQLAKRFNGFIEGTLAYTYGRSYSVTDPTSSVALSNYQFGRVFAGSQFDQALAPSAFDQPHRVLLNATVTAPWKRFPTNVTTYATRQSGTPFTYTYTATGVASGDLNGDGTNANDPIYVPTGVSDTRQQFVSQTFNGVTYSPAVQAQFFDQFIQNAECLRSQRGRIMARNSCRNPAFYRFDVTVEQGLPQLRGNRLTLRADIFNFANLLNPRWGAIRSATGNTNTGLLAARGFTTANLQTQVPQVSFNPTFVQFPQLLNPAAFYQTQLSLRYSF